MYLLETGFSQDLHKPAQSVTYMSDIP